MNLISLLIFFFLLENPLLAKNLHTDISKNKLNDYDQVCDYESN